MAKPQKRPLEAVEGSYSAIAHSVLDSVAFIGASYTAKALLLEMMRQHNGSNNGHLQLAYSWLKTRGWTSRSVIQRARAELLSRNLIICTKIGGLNMGASQYAVTWLSISNFRELDIASKDYHKGGYAFMNKLPLSKIKKAIPLGGTANTFNRDSTVPLASTAEVVTVP
ncbi:hypothetical protein [Nitrosospira briensis]|uniref:hypothetical protein n=1 Tax=Nitrosospira briensis TaxID=35799 RepID=UPI0008E18AC3|nr:hypothetical protein [Nitrosospira briensis]SFO33746.1 hypothetical protein SAMN05216332_11138 [Nitrosospira briensis]